jgi:hypothetical protein
MKTYLMSLFFAQFPLPAVDGPLLELTMGNTIVPSPQVLVGSWQCRFTFPLIGDRILNESLSLAEDGHFSSKGEFEYYLESPRQIARFSFSAQGKWNYSLNQLHLNYAPFEIKPVDALSRKYLQDIEKIYLSKSYKGTRRTVFYVEALHNDVMTIGDDYDSWQCTR